MAEKTRMIDIYEKSGTFRSVFRKFTGEKSDYNYKDMSLLRKLFSNEKARILNAIKLKGPNSIYELAKFLGRDFKTVREDLLLLKKFGFIDLIEGKSKNTERRSSRPVLTVNNITIIVRI